LRADKRETSLLGNEAAEPETLLFAPGERADVVFLHPDGSGGIGLDVPTSAVFWLSEQAWAALDGEGTGVGPGADEPTEARAEVAELLARGDITRLKDADTLPPLPDAAPQPVTTLALGVATECNLRCRYCFGREHGGRDDVLYHGPRGRMTREVALAAVAFLFERSAGAPELILNFFGGEPLLSDDIVEIAATAALSRAEAEKRRVLFSMTTNGTLLDERRLALLERLGIAPLISLDGPPEVHNHGRPFPDGRGSYEAAAAGARGALARNRDLMARATLTDPSVGYVPIAESLLALGFRRVHITAASPVDPGFGLGPDGFDQLLDPFTAFVDWFLEGVESGRLAGHFFGPLDHIIGDLYRRRAGAYACSAGLTGLYVTPDGDLYPCFRLVRDAYYLGNVLGGGGSEVAGPGSPLVRSAFAPEKRQPFADAAADRRPACALCFGRYICRGECAGDNLDENNDITIPTEGRCRLIRHYISEAARCLAHLSRRCPELLPERYPADSPPKCA
jgi:uncharacterized protein